MRVMFLAWLGLTALVNAAPQFEIGEGSVILITGGSPSPPSSPGGPILLPPIKPSVIRPGRRALDKRDGNINALLEAYSALLKTYTHDDKTFIGTYMVLLHLADVLAGKGIHVDTTGLRQATTTFGPSTKRQIFEVGGCKESDVIGLRATLTSLLLIYGNTPPFEIWNLEQAIIAALKACKQDVIVGPIVPDRPIPGGPIIPDKPTPGGPIIPDQPVPGGPIVTQSPVPGGPIQPSD